jgi:hypothetical protein
VSHWRALAHDSTELILHHYVGFMRLPQRLGPNLGQLQLAVRQLHQRHVSLSAKMA